VKTGLHFLTGACHSVLLAIGVLASLTREKIQKLRLGYEHDEGKLGPQSAEIEGIE